MKYDFEDYKFCLNSMSKHSSDVTDQAISTACECMDAIAEIKRIASYYPPTMTGYQLMEFAEKVRNVVSGISGDHYIPL